MRRQLGLSIGCALAFFVALLGLPLLNYFAPALMAVRVGGFTLTWLIVGVRLDHFVLLHPPLARPRGQRSERG
jgi:uncharacterized membrane protein (DUF485 family)